MSHYNFILHRFWDIITYFQKLKTSRDCYTTPTCGTICHPDANTLDGKPMYNIQSI